MGFISTIAIAMGSAWVSGINLYACVATLGLLGRFAHLQLPGELQILTSWWIIGVAATLYVIEFVADKVPLVDNTWDIIHTFIRVPAGAVLAAAAFGDFDRTIQVVAFLLGGGLALTSHGTKAAVRAIVNVSPEPVSNFVTSTSEDILAIVSIICAVFLPIALFVIVAAGLIVSVFVMSRIVRFFRSVFRNVRDMFVPLSSHSP